MRVLLAEDEQDMADVLEAILKREHYGVDVVNNGQDALDWALTGVYDGIILDVMMPRRNGLEVVSTLRKKSVDTPVLILTAKSQVSDKVAGLDAGADDYLSKPFDVKELIARVRALTRRGGNFTPTVMEIGNLTLDRATFELSNGREQIRLGSKEFQLFELLIRNQGHVLSTEQLMERIWGCESDAEINVVWAYISYLRRKLKCLNANVNLTASRGRGYMLETVQ